MADERRHLIVIRFDDDAAERDVFETIQEIKGKLERAS